ncbi:hypothetical protein A2U01_0071541, partial [Trifolium medium]|nr:hypothetical protein [Trifolium medium]
TDNNQISSRWWEDESDEHYDNQYQKRYKKLLKNAEIDCSGVRSSS